VSGRRGAVVRGSHGVFAMLAARKGLPRHTPACEGTASTAVILMRPGVRNDGADRRLAEPPPRAPSPAVAPVAVLAMLPASTAEPPTCCCQVMFAHRKECGPAPRHLVMLNRGLLLRRKDALLRDVPHEHQSGREVKSRFPKKLVRATSNSGKAGGSSWDYPPRCPRWRLPPPRPA
jgi:hypothetical protein